jgi:hypothetical protein
MTKDKILGDCKCLSKHEKDTLIMALNTATLDATKISLDTMRGINRVGAPPAEVVENMTRIIGSYNQLKDKVEKTPIC